jgi:hypothetical protein
MCNDSLRFVCVTPNILRLMADFGESGMDEI